MSGIMEAKKYFLKMVGACICDQPIPLCPDNIEAVNLLKLAQRNAVQGILYLAIKNGSVTLPESLEKALKNTFITQVMRDASQIEELAFIRKKFAEENIKFMFLKGTHLKSLYPIPEIRFMVDMDTLVREEDMNKGKKIFLDRGYNQEMNNGKDIVFIKPPFLTIELHKMLFVEDYFMHDYFTGVWNRAEQVNEHEYKMSINDLYVYTLAHLAEHYLEVGSCFRPIMDLFLIEKKYSDILNFDYINEQFSIIGIDKFALKIRQLYKCMFENGEYDEELIMMENYILLGPPIKNPEEASRIARSNKSKRKRIHESIFPSLKHMKLRYPLLEKVPFLLPLFWIIRIIQYILSKDTAKGHKHEQIQNVDQKSVEIMKEIFEKSGL